MLVFTLGKEYQVRHRVLCVVALAFGSNLCSFCCGVAEIFTKLRMPLFQRSQLCIR